MIITLDIPSFRVAIPAFADVTKYPDSLVTSQWDMGTSYISDSSYGTLMIDGRTTALQLMTAHLLAINDAITSGSTVGLVTTSKVGDVMVQMESPPYGSNPWRYWLMLTPYGMRLLALLKIRATGGFYIGGLPERAAFRKVGGIF